jgi:hypothetical protein
MIDVSDYQWIFKFDASKYAPCIHGHCIRVSGRVSSNGKRGLGLSP